jgi:FMN-dependent oxidoreductase (nitrilotriacetate monooxygenase family)
MAKAAESAMFDGIFEADFIGLPSPEHAARYQTSHFEPFTILSALAAVTSRIGLIGTASTTFNFPYNVARMFAALEQLSGGRAGWNVVTSYNCEQAYGIDVLPDPAARYERAQEFLDVVLELMHSWAPDAIIADVANRRYADPTKIKVVQFAGRHLKVTGALDRPSSPQGHPVIFQAGSSVDGLDFAARNAEGVFVASPTFELGVEFYRRLKERAVSHGRNADHLRVFPALTVFVDDDEREAAARLEAAVSHVKEAKFDDIEAEIGLDFRPYDPGSPVPPDAFPSDAEIEANPRRRSRLKTMKRLAYDLEFSPDLGTFLNKVALTSDHLIMIGTPDQIAATMQKWCGRAADGFIVTQAGDGPLTFIEKVIPRLVDRGVFRSEYGGTSLREHLGLPIPIY